MAGLDGIKTKFILEKLWIKFVCSLEEELKGVPTVCGSLREALSALDSDRDFLKAGNVFNDSLIDAYISLKIDEVIQFEQTPHPVEFKMYYSV